MHEAFPSRHADQSRRRPPILGKLFASHALAEWKNMDPAAIAADRFRAAADLPRALDFVRRSASGVADTTTAGWAAELVGQLVAEFSTALRPLSAFARLRELGLAFTLQGESIVVPFRKQRTAGGSGAAWVGENAVIPVVQALIAAGLLKNYKVAAIAPFSRELENATASQAEKVLQAAILQDLAELIDASLTDAVAANADRPAGLLNGITPTASVDVATDLRVLSAAMTAAQAMLPALLLHPDRLAALYSNVAYGPQLASGRLGPFAVIASYFVANAGNVIALDAAAFASGMGVPQVLAAKSAVLTMADAGAAAPTQAISAAGVVATAGEVGPDLGIHVAGAPTGAGTAGVQAMSMFQQNSVALRVVEPVSWAMTRAGAVAAISGAAW